MANVLYFGQKLKNVQVGSAGTASGATAVVGNSDGYLEVDPTDTDLVAAIVDQGAVLVDSGGSGTEEAATGGTVQTATTCSAAYLRANTATVVEFRNEDGNGTLLAGPFTIAAGKERVFVFPTPLAAPDGLFIKEVSGALDSAGTGDGFIIP